MSSNNEASIDAKIEAKQKQRELDPEFKAKWSVKRRIVFPFLLGFIPILLMLILTLLLPQAYQVGLVADWMALVFILCPALLIHLVLAVLVLIGIYGMNQLHKGVQPPLERLQYHAFKWSIQIIGVAEKINKGVVRWQSRLAPLMKFMRIFDQKESEKGRSDD